MCAGGLHGPGGAGVQGEPFLPVGHPEMPGIKEHPCCLQAELGSSWVAPGDGSLVLPVLLR